LQGPPSCQRRAADGERLIAREGLLVVGAEYSLEIGTVCFFDWVPEDA
jgi:hypothetical protein